MPKNDWPADKVERRSVSTLIPYARNARTHTPDQVAQIAASIKEWGWTNPVLIDEEGSIIAGHARVLAARKLGLADVPVMIAKGWTEAQRRAYVLADNQLAANADWDVGLLKLELGDLKLDNFDLDLIGFGTESLAEFLASPDGDASMSDHHDAGHLLERVNITIAEPRHLVMRGDHYVLAGRHHLLCLSVLRDWLQWAPLLREGAIFCPYPGPFVPYGTTADEHPLVMVQSDPYVAGHLLDRYEECFGADSITKTSGMPHVQSAA